MLSKRSALVFLGRSETLSVLRAQNLSKIGGLDQSRRAPASWSCSITLLSRDFLRT